METKTYIWTGIFIGSIIGSWIGSVLDHGNFFGLWSILFGGVGAIAGVWAGFKLGNG